MVLASSSPLEHVVAHDLFRIGPVVVNNHMLMTVVAGILMLLIFPLVCRRRGLVPSGAGNFFEAICAYLRDEVARPVLHQQTDRYIGYLWTTFFFILFCNLLGMVPVAAVLHLLSGGYLKGLGGTPTANIYVTGALAGCAFVTIHVGGIVSQVQGQVAGGRSLVAAVPVGFFRYWYKMVPPIDGVTGVLLFPLLFFLEFMGVAIKSVALAIRLFVNMVAGHTLLAVLLMLIGMSKGLATGVVVAGLGILGSVAISCLELFVAFLQAYIFTFLATLFIGMAVHQEH